MSEQVRHIDSLDEATQRVGQEIEVRMSAPEAAPQRTAESEASRQNSRAAADQPVEQVAQSDLSLSTGHRLAL